MYVCVTCMIADRDVSSFVSCDFHFVHQFWLSIWVWLARLVGWSVASGRACFIEIIILHDRYIAHGVMLGCSFFLSTCLVFEYMDWCLVMLIDGFNIFLYLLTIRLSALWQRTGLLF